MQNRCTTTSETRKGINIVFSKLINDYGKGNGWLKDIKTNCKAQSLASVTTPYGRIMNQDGTPTIASSFRGPNVIHPLLARLGHESVRMPHPTGYRIRVKMSSHIEHH
jgi:hypothetical protein